ncbi:hypothetical protein LTR56_013569 [Elasticomyces elasticus]|nr:hypothetical protein LTR56_013569 [Elasticomyces elasticus]KAK3651033.1 hypothetical protein LTR22_012281 [Elasticomyces elasticus]KAK4931111.1 hypothetical protein LTR49_002527 [Elasticomyces elasticus]KAK5765579.1 hypothetical protein LTS12_004331 [Elasticomyces elasticus]
MLILIAGITGGLGQRLATVALSRGLSVRGLGRSPDKLPADLAARLESFVESETYYDIPALDKAVASVDAVIDAYSPHPVLDLDAQLLLLRAAERAQIKVFFASTWSRDWTNLKYGEFEHYNNHIHFEHQAGTTSSIRPVYILSGLFANLLYTQYGPGAFNGSSGTPELSYYGEGDTDKWPWSVQDDVAEWTIDILLHGNGVQAGNGGFFRISSGVTTIRELASAYEQAFSVPVKVTRKGTLEDLKMELAKLRKDKGRAGYFEYMGEAAAVVASRGGWENADAIVLEQFRKPALLEQYLSEEKSEGRMGGK